MNAQETTLTENVKPPTRALLAIAAAQFLIVMDGTVVTVGLPNIGAALGIDDADLSWVLTGYALTFGGLLLVGGRLGDLFGHRRVYRGGLMLLILASLAGGFAVSGGMMLAARVGQGVAAALIAPAALTLLTTTFTGETERNKAMGAYGAMTGLGPVVGLLLGGAFTEYASWRLILLVNVPIALAILAGTGVLVEGDRDRGRIDLPGAITATLGLGALIFAVDRTRVDGWSGDVVVASGLASVTLLSAFVVIQRRSRSPMLPPPVLADQGRAGAYVAMLFVGGGMLAMYYFLTVYMQTVKGYSPMTTGLVYLPSALGTGIGAGAIGPWLTQRWSPRLVTVFGMATATAGAVWYLRLEPDQNPWVALIPAQTINGIGLGIGFVSLTIAGIRGVRPEDTGIASGVLNASTQVGGALGLSFLVTITASTATGTTPSALTDSYVAGLLGAAVLFLVAVLVAGVAIGDTHEQQPNRTLDSTTQQMKGNVMTLVRHHHYTVDPADLSEHLARRAKAIDAIRADHPGLVGTRLTRMQDSTFTDAWYWDSAENMKAAFAATREIPEVGPAMAYVSDHTAQNGEVVDER
jgi:EmrB/QacA subfamily drug resistance transporter